MALPAQITVSDIIVTHQKKHVYGESSLLQGISETGPVKKSGKGFKIKIINMMRRCHPPWVIIAGSL